MRGDRCKRREAQPLIQRTRPWLIEEGGSWVNPGSGRVVVATSEFNRTPAECQELDDAQ